jgi:hypothetical protein
MFRNDLHRLTASRSLEHGRIGLDLLENAAQCLSNQHVVIDYKYFHVGDPACSTKQYFIPRTEASPPACGCIKRKVDEKQALSRRAAAYPELMGGTSG